MAFKRSKQKNQPEEYDTYLQTDESEEAAGVTKGFTWRKGLIIGCSVICAIALITAVILILSMLGANGYNPVDELHRYDLSSYKTNTRVLYSAETKGTVGRVKPVEEVKDERGAFDTPLFSFDESKRYPTYGSTLGYVLGTTDDKVAARQALINESAYLCAWGTSNATSSNEQTPDKYTIMDKDGWLYQIKDGQRVHSLVWGATQNVESNYRRLYKHSAAEGMYLGNVADDEKAVVKEITLRNRSYSSYSVTGVYAPAGEVIKIEMSDADMKATGGITIHIGQALYNGQANNIWDAKNQMQRFPIILNTMSINRNTAEYDESTGMWTGYVGSFVGGPIYIRNNAATFTVTVSGGIPYSHFILGYTTEKEFEETSKTSVPYFDLEVWDRGVLHSGPKRYAQNFSYADLYKAAVLWDKVASVTTTGSNQGIVFLYDTFVAAGAAVAFPGRSSVNCPLDWMPSSLNYDALVTSGSWGNFHEYHHNFQGYGVGDGGEVTNNGMTLVSYALFTKISSKRGISNFGAQGLGGWNNYTSAPWALEETLKIARPNENPGNGNKGLALYATLLHNFGADNYIKAKVAGGGQSYAAYMNAWQNVTHNNMYYYFKDVLQGTDISNNANPDYPMFVPVSCVFQTGRSYMYDGVKRYFNTMQPYVIPYGSEFTVDLRNYYAPNGQYSYGSVVIPSGFSYEITNIRGPENGTLAPTETPGVYIYKPDGKAMKSGKIYVTLKITKDDKSFAVDDVDLVLEFEQSHETKKFTLERTTYTYTAESMYTDAVTAYENKFSGYTNVVEKWDHCNPTQNVNTDIWFYPDTEENRANNPGAPESYFFHDNTVEVIDGKLFIQEDGKYRVFMRGRVNCALYYSIGGTEYKLGAKITNGSGAAFYLDNPETYFDVEFKEDKVYVNGELVKEGYKGVRWVYIKEVLIVQSSARSYIGVGLTQWTTPMFTITVDQNNVTHYFNSSGKEVTAEEANSAAPIAPTSAAYVNAYRNTYEFAGGFESEYFYIRNYNYDYKDNVSVPKEEVTVTETNYTATGWGAGMPIENISDDNTGTYIHTSWQVSVNNPLNLTFDLGTERNINRITFQCRNNNGMLETPKVFTVEGSLDGTEWFNVAEYTDAPRNGNQVNADFDETTLRYCRIKISAAHQGNGSYFIVIGEVTFTHSTEVLGGTQIAPDDAMFNYKGNWHGAQTASSFGHVCVGTKNASVTFEFEGTRIGILSSDAYGHDFEVKIDGKKVESIQLKDESGVSLVFLTDKLSEGKHTVTIKCKDVSNIDSFAIYP